MSPLEHYRAVKRRGRVRASPPDAAAVSRPALEVADIFRDHGRHGARPMPAMSASTNSR